MTLPKPSGTTEVVITGASSGIGTELGRVLAARGYSLFLVARRQDRLDALADAHRDGVDVRDEIGCDVLCAHASIVAEARCYPRVRGVKPTRPFVEPVTGWVSAR